jgi:hypothetical protein
MANGQQLKIINFEKFEAWKKNTPVDELAAIVHGGKLKREDIATQVGFGKSALYQNSLIKPSLAALEDDLREKGVLPKLLDKSAEKVVTQQKEYNYDEKKINVLRRQNAYLEATVVQLKAKLDKLERFSETSDVLSSFFED